MKCVFGVHPVLFIAGFLCSVSFYRLHINFTYSDALKAAKYCISMCPTSTHFWGCAGCPLGLVLYTLHSTNCHASPVGVWFAHTPYNTDHWHNDYNNGITLFQNCYTDSVQTCAASSVASEVEVYPHSGSTGTTMYIKYVTQNSTIYFNSMTSKEEELHALQQLTYMIIHNFMKSDIKFLNKVHSRSHLSRLFHSWHIVCDGQV